MRLVTTRGDGDLTIITDVSTIPGRWFTGYRAKMNAWENIILRPDVYSMFRGSDTDAEAAMRHQAAVDAVDAALLSITGRIA